MKHIAATQNITIEQITNYPCYFHNAHIYDEIKLPSLPKFLQNLCINFQTNTDNELTFKACIGHF